MLNTDPPIEAVLAGLPLFGGLGDVAIGRLAGGATQLRVPRGALLFHPKTPCDGVHAIIDGQVKLSQSTRPGNERVLAIAGPGDTLCVENLFGEQAYEVSAEALEDVMLLHVGKPVLLAELEQNSAFAHALIQTLSGRVAAIMRDLESCTLLSARERVVEFLLQLAYVADGSTRARLRLPANKRIVASRLNLTHEHFSRILHRLADEEMIRIEGRNIEIANAPCLRALMA